MLATRHRNTLLAGGLFLLAAGCGGAGDGPPRVPVAGTVTIDGKPIERGLITFTPIDRPEPVVSGVIEDGEAKLGGEDAPVPGRHLVQVWARKETGRLVRDPDNPRGRVPEVRDVVPVRYNAETELTAQVDEDGSNQFKFELRSEPATSSKRVRRQ